jgi:hypothetical protein
MVIQKILDSPERVAMLSVVPEPIIQVTTPDIELSPRLNIGYAEFSLPSDQNPEFDSQIHGDVVMMDSEQLSLVMLAPENIDVTDIVNVMGNIELKGSMPKAKWITEHLVNAGEEIDPEKLNIVDLQMRVSEVHPLPFTKVFMMSDAEYHAYIIKLTTKSLLSSNMERIIPFESPHSLGIIYMREGGRRGKIELTTHDRKISQAIIFEIHGTGDTFPPEVFKTFLASYRFTIESCPSREEIAEMISASGICAGDTPEKPP